MLAIPQSTSHLCIFKAFSDTDHVTEATGKTIAITISKNGGAFGNPNAGATNATEISAGWYKVTLDTTDTGTLGPLAVRGTNADIDDVGVWYQVVKATNGGMTALPDAAAEAAGGLYTRGSGAGQINQPANGLVDVNQLRVAGSATPSTNLSKTTQAIARGTVTTGGSTTSVPTSALSIAGSAASGVVADQFKNRVVLFDGDTTTAGLRGAAATISVNTASNTPTFTVGTLPDTPASGDTFSVI